MKLIPALLFLLSVGAMSCHKGSPAPVVSGNYIIVGHMGGLAGSGAVSNYYLISNGQFKKDPSLRTSDVPIDVTKFNFSITIPDSVYHAVSGLLGSIPTELLGRNGADIGTAFPDAGTTDIRASVNGVAYRWGFEGDQSGSSAAIQAFLQKAVACFAY